MTDFCPTPGPLKTFFSNFQEIHVNAPNGDPTLGFSAWEGLATFYGCDDNPVEGSKVALSNARLFVAAKHMLEVLEGYRSNDPSWDQRRLKAIEYAKTGVFPKSFKEKKVDALCKVTDFLVDLMEKETDSDIKNVYSELHDNLCREQCELMGNE